MAVLPPLLFIFDTTWVHCDMHTHMQLCTFTLNCAQQAVRWRVCVCEVWHSDNDARTCVCVNLSMPTKMHTFPFTHGKAHYSNRALFPQKHQGKTSFVYSSLLYM